VGDDGTAIAETIASTVQLLVQSGMSEDQAVTAVVDEVSKSIDPSVQTVYKELLDKQPKLMRQERRLRRLIHADIYKRWGSAFDAFYVAAYSIAEAADVFVSRHAETAERSGDDVFEVLVGLHERGRRIAWEIHHLFTGGFPLGALARARTLYELAVVGTVIGEYGRLPQHRDLARRYLDHRVIAVERHAREYQRTAEHRGYAPYEAAYLQALATQRDAVIALYGKEFKEANGWAACLTTTGHAAKFDYLEQLAATTHLRSDYQWMCSEVHAGSIGLILNTPEVDSQLGPLIGPTDSGFGEPGEMALTSLMSLTWALFISGNPNQGQLEVTDYFSLRVLALLGARFGVLADNCEPRIEA